MSKRLYSPAELRAQAPRASAALAFSPDMEVEYRRAAQASLRPAGVIAVLVGAVVIVATAGVGWAAAGSGQQMGLILAGVLGSAAALRLVCRIQASRATDDIADGFNGPIGVIDRTGAEHPANPAGTQADAGDGLAGTLLVAASAAVGVLLASGTGSGLASTWAALLAVWLGAVMAVPARRWLPVSALALWGVTLATTAWAGLPAAVWPAMAAVWTASAIGVIAMEVAMRRLWLQARISSALGRMDPLTGVLNRRGFDAELEPLYRAAAASQRSVAVGLLDLDHFKSLNDHHGHDYGDVCLQSVGQLLSQHAAAPDDLAGRMGGEEFVLVWFDVDVDALQARCQALRDDLAMLNMEHRGLGAAGRLTASLGVVLANAADHPEPAALLRQADALLYAVKDAGRDQSRIEVLGPPATDGDQNR